MEAEDSFRKEDVKTEKEFMHYLSNKLAILDGTVKSIEDHPKYELFKRNVKDLVEALIARKEEIRNKNDEE